MFQIKSHQSIRKRSFSVPCGTCTLLHHYNCQPDGLSLDRLHMAQTLESSLQSLACNDGPLMCLAIKSGFIIASKIGFRRLRSNERGNYPTGLFEQCTPAGGDPRAID